VHGGQPGMTMSVVACAHQTPFVPAKAGTQRPELERHHRFAGFPLARERTEFGALPVPISSATFPDSLVKQPAVIPGRRARRAGPGIQMLAR